MPLLGLLHVEASAVVAFAAFFIAGLGALPSFEEGRSFKRVWARQEALLLVPLALLTVTLLWRPNCDYLQGLLLYLLFPPVTVILAVALAYAIVGGGLRFQKTALVGVGLAISVVGPVYDLGFHPQFYTYNHVFGGVLGPLYDEELALRPGLFAFRGLTLLWALLLFLTGRWLRGRRPPADGQQTGGQQTGRTEDRRFAILATGLLIGLCYLNAAHLGFNTPAWYLQDALGGHRRTAHFDIYYDPASLSDAELARLAEDHEYRYTWLAEKLDVAPEQRIASYLYPDEEVKARLTGARRTGVAPVWLRRPQTHVLLDAYDHSFGHELVHTFSRSFGLPVLKASWSVGLVEGLAVAFEPPDGRPTPDEQVSAAALMEAGDRAGASLSADVAARLSPLGFWTGRGAVSYTTMGSFVRFLHERYGAGRLRRVYAWGRFEEVYGKPVEALADEWQAALFEQPLIARATGPLVARRFAVPSLFERRCPHYVPPYRRVYRAGREALARGDTTEAAHQFEQALRSRPGFASARTARARLAIDRGRPRRALRLLQEAPAATGQPPSFYVAQGDALALVGRTSEARERYKEAGDALPLYRHGRHALLLLRAAVADRPVVVRALTGGGAAAVKARRLAAPGAVREPARVVLRALYLAAADQSGRAETLLRTVPAKAVVRSGGEQQAMLHRQRLVWLAHFAYRSRNLVRAAADARKAARAFRNVGDFNAARLLEDFQRKVRWVHRVPVVGVR